MEKAIKIFDINDFDGTLTYFGNHCWSMTDYELDRVIERIFPYWIWIYDVNLNHYERYVAFVFNGCVQFNEDMTYVIYCGKYWFLDEDAYIEFKMRFL